MIFPVFTPPLANQQQKKKREKSETQALSLNLSQFRPLLILFSHLTQSFICTLGNLLIPLEELFMPLLSPSRLYRNTARTIFRIINSQLHLLNLNEEAEMNHLYIFVSIIYLTITVLFIQPVRQKVELSLMEKLTKME